MPKDGYLHKIKRRRCIYSKSAIQDLSRPVYTIELENKLFRPVDGYVIRIFGAGKGYTSVCIRPMEVEDMKEVGCQGRREWFKKKVKLLYRISMDPSYLGDRCSNIFNVIQNCTKIIIFFL